jgi:hypothetical protein
LFLADACSGSCHHLRRLIEPHDIREILEPPRPHEGADFYHSGVIQVINRKDRRAQGGKDDRNFHFLNAS